MLQPRKRKFILKIVPKGLLLCVIILLTFTQNLNFAKGEDEKNGLIKDKIKRGDRVIRHGDVNIVVLDDFDRRKITPSLGLLSTTARTFIQEGTTTEFATHVYGTTVGDKYAHIVSTGSKIFYDNIRPAKDKTADPIITIPALDSLIFSEDNYIIPSKVIHEKPSEKVSPEKFSHKLTIEKHVTPNKEDSLNKLSKSLKANTLSISEKTPVTVTSPAEIFSKNIHNHISVRKEISIKPARVKIKNELPTFTVKQDSSELESHVNQIQNSEFEVDNAIVLNKNEKEYIPEKTPRLYTTTYFGFADFVTTAGNTVIIFTPQTKKPVFEGTVTSIQGEPILVQNTILPSSTKILSSPPPPTTLKPIELVESVETTESSEMNISYNEQTESSDSMEYIESDQRSPPTEPSIEEQESNDEQETPTTQKEYKYDEGIPITTPLAIETTAESIDSTFESVTENVEENQVTTTIGDDLVKNKEVPFLESSYNLESSFSSNLSPSSTQDVYQTVAYTSTLPSSILESQSTTSSISTTEEIPESTTSSNISISDESGTEATDLLHGNNNVSTNTERNDYEEVGSTTTPKTNKSEEEVELIFKTLYTTYTYLTTYFERSTTQVKSREEVVTNVVTSTLDSAFLQLATDPAVAGLFSGHREAKYLLTNGVGRPTTFYHRISSEPISENEIVSSSEEAQKSTPSLKFHPRLTSSRLKPLPSSSVFDYGSKSDHIVHTPSTADPHALLKTRLYSSARASHRLGPSLRQTPPLHLYKSTIIRHKLSNSIGSTESFISSSVNNVLAEKTTRESIIPDEVAHNSVIISAPLTSTKETTEQTQKKIFLPNDSDDDQLSQESNTEGTRPNPSLISLQTSYTTYTYFTTIYKGSTSDIISRLETVTNVNTELIKPTSTELTLSSEEVSAPVTYYTTYTYWTTFYKDGSTMIKSRQETVSSVLTATSVQESATESIQPTSMSSLLDPVTYYTTFTYFTTSYVDNSSVVSSHLQTVTNIIEASKTTTDNPEESSSNLHPIFESSNSVFLEGITKSSSYLNDTLPRSTIISEAIYPQFFENTSQNKPLNNLNSSSITPVQDPTKPTGTISVEEGRIIDAFNISTTYYTTRVIGTYIQTLYAELIESTSSIHVNTEQRSNLISPSTVILNDRIFQTGLLLTNEGSIVKGSEITHYATKIIGSIINGLYSSVTETSSSVQVIVSPSRISEIKPTSSVKVPLSSSTQITEFTATSPSPAVIESSLNEHHDGNEEDDNTKNKSRRKSFTPVIRPFASRSRPTFLPKKKTGETSVAATITRGITPTIVASPALKTSETRVFGSVNRNRFAGGSRKISSSVKQSTELESATPTSRRFSRPKSNIPFSSANSFQRTSSAVPASFSSYRRGSGYRPSSSRALDIQPSSSSAGSRFRIRPTSSRRFNFGSTSTTPKINDEELDNIEEDASIITEQTLSEFGSDELSLEKLSVSSTEVSQRNNPLLRFRKPGTARQSSVQTTSTFKTTTQRRNIGSRRNDKLTPPPTTAKPSTSFPPRSNYLSNKLRLKPANSLFPQKNSSTKTEGPAIENGSPEILAAENGADIEQIESGEYVTELEPDQNFGNSNVEEKSTRGSRTYNPVSIKPFPRRGRVKRQSEYGYKYENVRSQNSRYRRPTVSQNTFPDYLYYDDLEYTTEDISARSIGTNRNTYSKSRNTQPLQHSYQSSHQQQPEQQVSHKIRPSGVSHGRTPFTLREKTPSTSPAPQRSSSRHRGSSTNRKHDSYVTKRPSRQRYYSTTTEPSYRNSNRKQLPTRRTSNTRSRYKDNDYNSANTYSSASFDGTITVTYKIPTEATIPIVNGKVTEYKNVVTAKPSIQVLGPNQYSTVTGKNGLTTLQLVAENSETMLNGIVEVTRYIIQEFPTSSITFTPTTIRGRKTSFSHIIPSTVYEVRPEISTIPPQLNGNAPLANLLLSQLLLGNLGIQPTLNPLLGLNGQQANGQPVTEYKTKTTSYVTTITHSTSTVIPITLRGKEIKTTIVDSSTQVITATEYLTDTVVITPTNVVQAPSNQLNTLLLPALLQAQLLNQPQSSVAASLPPTSSGDENIADNLQLIQDNPMPSRVLKNTFNLDNDNVKVNDDLDQQKDNSRKKLSKPKSFDSPIEPAETSVVTLYLSGRRPGEFSTVLSTVTLDDEKSATLRKRHIDTVQPEDLKPSNMLPLHTSLATTDDDYIDSVLKSGLNDISVHVLESEHQETQSLESIIGDVSEHMLQKQLATQLENGEAPVPSTKTLNQVSNHFLLKTSAEDAPFQRNFTTSVSRGERKKRSPELIKPVKKVVPNLGLLPELYLRDRSRNLKLLKESYEMLNAQQESNILDIKQKNSRDIAKQRLINQLKLIKNDSLTVEDEGRGRYNLATKVMSNGVEVIIALDKSTLPGSPQLLRVLPTSIRPITLTPSTVTDHMIMMLPHGLQDIPDPFITKTYLTTYTYLTTFLNEGITSTSSQEKVVSNIFTENIDSTSPFLDVSSVDRHVTLSSSPILATKVFETTYNVESTIRDGDTPHVVLSQQTVSNTITAPEDFLQPSEASFNEISPLPSKETPAEEYSIYATEKLSANFESQTRNSIDVKPSAAPAADITKTYFVTYTYYSTLLENGSTVVRSKVATSSDVVTEKYYAPLKRTKIPPNPVPTSANPTNVKPTISVPETMVEKPIHILATKTYLTTFTYFTTLLQENKINKSTNTMIRSRTKVVQNLVTETLNPDLLNSEYLSVLKNSLKKDSMAITATATLNDGQRLEITAVNENSPSSFSNQVVSSLEENEVSENEIGNENQIKSDNSVTNTTGPAKNPKINETRYTFSSAVLPSATVVKHGVTLSPGSQVIKFTDLVNGNISVIPVSDPVSKYPIGGQHVNRPDTKIQMNDLLSLGSALKPVINAVAGLWQNNVKANIKASESNIKPISHPYIDKNPIEDLLTSLKPPNRTPIYIPVGHIQEDNEGAESEDVYQHQYPDVDERNILSISGNKEAVEKPLVSGGGIPISPGQVITANTDVIVGTPAVLGPRPPPKSSNDKSDIPIGMRPPPVSSLIPNYSSEEGDRGSSVNSKYGEFIKIPPKPLSPTFLNNVFPPSNNIKHSVKPYHKYGMDQKLPLPSEIKFSQVHPNAPPPPTKKPTPMLDIDENIIQPAKLQHPILIEHSTLNPLLVNLRPSQVAQVIIPHGSQTAFVYSDEPVSHNTKGEIFNDPSPYPEENVNPGFVGLEVYGPVNSHAHPPHTQGTSSKVSSNTIHLDIPINPFITNGSITESHHFVTVNLDANSPIIPSSNEISLANGEEPFQNDLRNNFSATVHSNIDVANSPSHLLPWQPPVYSSERPYQRPYIFPQDKTPVSSDISSEPQSHFNLINSHGENEAIDDNVESVAPSENDELIQETKIKSSSNSDTNLSKTEDSYTYIGKEPSNPVDSDVDLEFNHNWEILKEKPAIRSTTSRPTNTINNIENNSTVRDHGNVIYTQWNTMETPASIRPNFSEITVHGNIGHLDHNAGTNSENVTKINNRKPVSNRNSQDDIVIGLSPPPLLQPSVPPPSPPVQPIQSSHLPPSVVSKLPRPLISNSKPALSDRKPLPSRRPSPLKNKPKPTNPPYPFEKPTPVPPTHRPKPAIIIDKPPPNILYETNAPNFGDDLMKLKPLNTTGKIEPVKKWPAWSTTGKPNSTPVYGNIEKVQELDKKEETKLIAKGTIPTTSASPNSNNRGTTDSSALQSDTKIIVIEKQDQINLEKTTELISKWSESGVISSSKNDLEETYEDRRTPLLEVTNRTKSNSVPNTIFGNLYTRPPPANIVIIPTHSTTQHHTAISMVIDQDPSSERDSDASYTFNLKNNNIAPTNTYPINQSKIRNKENRPADKVDHSMVTPTYYITHTTTSFVTITQSTVVERDGQPTTRTVVLTKTQTSTLIDTVTKVETLLQPTSVLSTITSTIPITVSKEIISTVTATDVLPSIVTPIYSEKPSDNDSIFVVMTDKKSGHIAPAPPIDPRPTGFEVQVPDEANEISPNDILFSGIYTQHADNECRPECKVTKNEMCQKVDNTMRCVCRPGFARIFPDHPCKPTYTYLMRVPLDRQGSDEIRYTDSLADRTSPSHQQLTEATRDGLDRMVMQSNLRDIYHGVVVSGFEPAKKSNKAAVVYIVQLSENAEETKLQDEIHKTLKANNYSLGGTDVYAAPDMYHFIQAEDFDECSDNKYHDCSDNAQCFNQRGTYTCSCKEGFTDMSYNAQFPGRVCSADGLGCELCNYHGTCYYKAEEEPTCECFQWYAGEFCQINLKVTLISLIAIGILLTILLIVCLVMTCNKPKSPEILRAAPKPHVGFRRYRSVTNIPGDKRAIVSVDTSSEGSIERTPPPLIKKSRIVRSEPPHPVSIHGGESVMVHNPEQRDRNLTVLIPRAKYRPVSSQPSSTLLTMSTFGPEQKLLNYAASRESSRTPEKKVSRCSMHSRRLSNSTNMSAEAQPRKKISAPRRPSSGALVSAGFEVSATVRRTQELDEAFITPTQMDLNQPTYNSIRTVESSTVVDVSQLPVFESALEDFITRVDKLGTVSEARSYDETTIQPPMRSLHNLFHLRTHTCDSKHSSSHKTNLDENHTMGERDLGSTYMPKSQLYKPDHRESDGSNFDSL